MLVNVVIILAENKFCLVIQWTESALMVSA